MKIGLLGGTFDPIHNGHLILAQNAHKAYDLDEVWFLVSPDPPHKLDKTLSNYEDRCEMVVLGVSALTEGKEGIFKISDYEKRLPQPSYTAQTLRALHNDFPENEFYFIIGEDSLDNIEKWFEPAEVMKMTVLLVAVRKESDDIKTIDEQIKYLTGKYDADIRKISSDYVDISSTQVRNNVSSGEKISGLVPENVEEYIWKKRLYTLKR